MDSSKVSALLLICMLFISSATPILGCGSCGEGGKPSPKPRKPKSKSTPPTPKSPSIVPPVTVPKVPIPPVTVPKLPLPPVTVPEVPIPPVTAPKLPLPPATVPKLPLPPATVPKLPIPPVTPIVSPVAPVVSPVIPIVSPVIPIVSPVVPIISPITPIISPVTPILPPIPIIGGKNPPSTPSGSPAKGCPPPPYSQQTCPIDTLKLGACVDLLGGLVHIGLGDPIVNQCCPVLKGLAELEAAVCLCTTLKIKALNLNVYVPLAIQLLITCGKTPPAGYTCSL